MQSAEYKIFHESFMKNNNGTTPFDSFLYILPSSFAIFHSITLTTYLKLGNSTNSNANVPLRFLIEFVVICFSLVLCLTVLSNIISHIVIALSLITLTSIAKQLNRKCHLLTQFVVIPSVKSDFITIGRSIISLITSVCILAVDFQIFPRKLAKTEKFGFGLMDVGVGLFIFSNGIVAKPSSCAFSKKKFQKLLVSSIPLLLLGFSRFLVTKEINYQEHVTEYGVHWNFFITLATTKIIGSIFEGFLKTTDHIKYSALMLLMLHETVLQLGLSNYIMDDNVARGNFLSANREGIFSIPGYVALYLGSIYVGTILQSEGQELLKVRDVFQKTIKLGVVSAFCWKMIFVCNSMFGVSRRTANMGYAFWVLAVGTSMLTLFMMTEIFIYYINFNRPQWQQQAMAEVNNKSQLDEPDFHIPYVPLILQAINYNGLAFFLIANVFTGIVNVCFQTMLLGTSASILVITYYTFLLNVIMVFLYCNKFKLKIW